MYVPGCLGMRLPGIIGWSTGLCVVLIGRALCVYRPVAFTTLTTITTPCPHDQRRHVQDERAGRQVQHPHQGPRGAFDETNKQPNKQTEWVLSCFGFYFVCVCLFCVSVGASNHRGARHHRRCPPRPRLRHMYVRQHKQGTFVSGVAMDGKVKVTFTGTQVGPFGRICLPWFVCARGCRGVWT